MTKGALLYTDTSKPNPQSPLPSHSPIRHLMLTPCGIFSLLIRPAAPMQRCNAKHCLAPFPLPRLLSLLLPPLPMPPQQQQRLQDLACGFFGPLRPFLLVPYFYPIWPLCIFYNVPHLCSRPRRLLRRKGHLGSALPNAACCATPPQCPALAPATLALGPVQIINLYPRITCLRLL